MKRKSLLIAFLAITMARLSAQTWEVPEDKKARVSPFKFSSETVAKGQDIFKRNCTSCHGEPTKGNFQPLVPPPGDPATDKFQKQLDGALFYKMTTGRGPMPTFKEILTEDERWDVISYFRSFNKTYVQPDIAAGGQTAGQVAKLAVTYDSIRNKLNVFVTDTVKKPLKGANITVLVKRYFGNMAVADASSTNEKGYVSFQIPKDIPGDKDGNIELIVKLSNESGSDIKKSIKLAIGVPTNKPPLTQSRAMWNISIKAPIWLLLSYTLVVVGIWSFLIYIVLQLVKIKKSSKNNI
jgi:mono/diheme cytochrome c family protein